MYSSPGNGEINARNIRKIFNRSRKEGVIVDVGKRGHVIRQRGIGYCDDGIPGQDGVYPLFRVRADTRTFQYRRAGVLPPPQTKIRPHGLGDHMKEEMMDKKAKLAYAKSVDAERKTVTAYVSTYEWDRTLEKFAPGAWDLTNYKKNPVILWGHDGSIPPIGRAIDIKEDANGLIAVAEFDTESERGAEIFGLYERGFLNAFSVGFIPKAQVIENIPEHGTKGTVWTDAELLEFSAVSIPANPGAMITREIAEMAIKCLGDSSVTKGSDGETFLVSSPEMSATVEKEPEERLVKSLEQLITLARVVKGKPIDKSKLALVGTATSLLNEIISDNDQVPAEDIEKLHNVVKELAQVVGSLNPDSEAIVKKTLANISKALGK